MFSPSSSIEKMLEVLQYPSVYIGILDIDGTTYSPQCPKGLSPYIINKFSNYDEVYFCTHRCDLQYNGFEKQDEVRQLIATIETLRKKSAEGNEQATKSIKEAEKTFPDIMKLDITPEDSLTHKIIENFTQATGVPCGGVASPGSALAAYNATRYALVLKSSSKKLASKTIQLAINKDGYEYCVIGVDEKVKQGVIPWAALPPNAPREEKYIKGNEGTLLPAILDFTSNAGHTPTKEKVKSQFVDIYSKQVDSKCQADHLGIVTYIGLNSTGKITKSDVERASLLLKETLKEIECNENSKNVQLTLLLNKIAAKYQGKNITVTYVDDLEVLCDSAAKELQAVCNQLAKKYGGQITLQVIRHSVSDNLTKPVLVSGTPELYPSPVVLPQQTTVFTESKTVSAGIISKETKIAPNPPVSTNENPATIFSPSNPVNLTTKITKPAMVSETPEFLTSTSTSTSTSKEELPRTTVPTESKTASHNPVSVFSLNASSMAEANRQCFLDQIKLLEQVESWLRKEHAACNAKVTLDGNFLHFAILSELRQDKYQIIDALEAMKLTNIDKLKGPQFKVPFSAFTSEIKLKFAEYSSPYRYVCLNKMNK